LIGTQGKNVIISRAGTVMDTVQEISRRVFRKQRGPSSVMKLVRELPHELMLLKIHQCVFRRAAHSRASVDGEKSRHGELRVSERTHFPAVDTTGAGNRPTVSHPWDPPGLTRAEQVDLRLRRAAEHGLPSFLHVQDSPFRMHTID
jgi:hypothetical protein